MPLVAYALLSLDELKRHLFVTGPEKDDALEDVINETTEDWEAELGRLVVTRGALTEYHTMASGGLPLAVAELRPRQWPIISVTSVHEDTSWPRTYGAPTALVADTGYQVVRDQRDYLRRLDSGGWGLWAPGVRAIRLVYQAGYATTAAVPHRIKARAKELAALKWREIERKAQGILSQSDSMGNFTRFGAARITDEMRAAMQAEYRIERYETAEAA